MTSLIDCHAHVLPSQIRDDGAQLRGVLERCDKQGVATVVVSLAWNRGSFEVGPEPVQQVAAGHDVRLAFTFGFQPPDTAEAASALHVEMPEAAETARALASEGTVCGIGEVGLDYYWPVVGFLEGQGFTKRNEIDAEIERRHAQLLDEPAVRRVLDAQAETFKRWIGVAGELGLPLVVHERDAYGDAVRIIEESGLPPERVMLHCFSAGVAEAHDAMAKGYWLSVPASVVYRQPYVDIAQAVNLDKALLETDSPYHSPIVGLWKTAFRTATEQAKAENLSGRQLDTYVNDEKERLFAIALDAHLPGLTFPDGAERAFEHFKSSKHRSTNEPTFVRCGAVALAELRGLSFDDVCRQTTENARKFYGL